MVDNAPECSRILRFGSERQFDVIRAAMTSAGWFGAAGEPLFSSSTLATEWSFLGRCEANRAEQRGRDIFEAIEGRSSPTEGPDGADDC